MDLLEKYKKTWDNQPDETKQFSALEIYKLAHSKSSSIVVKIPGLCLLIFPKTVFTLFCVLGVVLGSRMVLTHFLRIVGTFDVDSNQYFVK